VRLALPAIALTGCANVLGIPDETHVHTFTVEANVIGARGASDSPLQLVLEVMSTGEQQTLPITGDGVFTFPNGLLNGIGFQVRTTPMCSVVNDVHAIDNANARIEVRCDGLLGLSDFNFSAPIETTGSGTSLHTYGSLLTQRTTLKPIPLYNMPPVQSGALAYKGGVQVDDLGVAVMQNDSFEVKVSNVTSMLPMTMRQYFTSVDVSGPPAQFGYGKAPAASDGGHYGTVIDTFGRYVLVGMPDAGNGHAVLYSRFGRTWTQVAVFDGPNPGERFGTAVAIGKNTTDGKLFVLVGAPGANTVYAYKQTNTQWDLTMLNGPSAGEFGAALAVHKASNGNVFLVGAPGQSAGAQPSAGGMYAYSITGLSNLAIVTATIPTPNARFGAALAISENGRVAIGAPGERSSGDLASPAYEEAGAVYLYMAVTFISPTRQIASHPGASDHYGSSVAITDTVLAVGAALEDSGSATDDTDNSKDAAGAVFVYGQGLPAEGVYVKAPNLDTGDGFGSAVALHTEGAMTLLVVGAPFEDSGLSGVDKAMADETAPDAGAAYLYQVQGTTVTFKHYLKASNAALGDLFGAAVAITDDSLLVGAPYEDSNATGWNNGQGDGDVDGDNGAVYAFR